MADAEATDEQAQDATVLRFPSNRPDRTPIPDEPAPRLRSVIGDVLRDERIRQDRTLADVAAGAAVSLPYLSEIERGTKEVSSDVLHAITSSLDLALVEVLERSVERLRVRTESNGRIQLRAA